MHNRTNLIVGFLCNWAVRRSKAKCTDRTNLSSIHIIKSCMQKAHKHHGALLSTTITATTGQPQRANNAKEQQQRAHKQRNEEPDNANVISENAKEQPQQQTSESAERQPQRTNVANNGTTTVSNAKERL